MVRKMLFTAVTAVAMGTALAPAADAGVVSCVYQYVDHGVEAWYFDCNLSSTGYCLADYDPLMAPFPTHLVPESTQFPLCLAI